MSDFPSSSIVDLTDFSSWKNSLWPVEDSEGVLTWATAGFRVDVLQAQWQDHCVPSEATNLISKTIVGQQWNMCKFCMCYTMCVMFCVLHVCEFCMCYKTCIMFCICYTSVSSACVFYTSVSSACVTCVFKAGWAQISALLLPGFVI